MRHRQKKHRGTITSSAPIETRQLTLATSSIGSTQFGNLSTEKSLHLESSPIETIAHGENSNESSSDSDRSIAGDEMSENCEKPTENSVAQSPEPTEGERAQNESLAELKATLLRIANTISSFEEDAQIEFKRQVNILVASTELKHFAEISKHANYLPCTTRFEFREPFTQNQHWAINVAISLLKMPPVLQSAVKNSIYMLVGEYAVDKLTG